MKTNKQISDAIVEFVKGFKSMPTDINVVEVEVKDDYIDIIIEGVLHNKICYGKDNVNFIQEGCGYRPEELKFSAEILERMDEIINLIAA